MLQVGPWVFGAGQIASDYKTGVAPEARRNLEAVKLGDHREFSVLPVRVGLQVTQISRVRQGVAK